MFTVYVDDSGTSPSQRVAVAAALIVPAVRIEAFESEWSTLRGKHQFSDMHASECRHRNPKSEFAGWDDGKVRRVFDRTCEISMKYSPKAISYGLRKTDYDEALTEEWKQIGGRTHYAWAVRQLVRQLEHWYGDYSRDIPLEFVFDWPGSDESKEEIDRVMAQEESLHPGRYKGHYVFKPRRQLAGLQCVDTLAWTGLQIYRKVIESTPLDPFAEGNYRKYTSRRRAENWWDIYTDESRESLLATFRKDQADEASNQKRRDWMEDYRDGLRKSGRKVPR